VSDFSKIVKLFHKQTPETLNFNDGKASHNMDIHGQLSPLMLGKFLSYDKNFSNLNPFLKLNRL